MIFIKKPYLFQGIYYLLTGIWPILHIESFMRVSGPKMDIWLVKTVGVLIIVIGATLLVPLFTARKSLPLEAVVLGILSTLGFMIIDIYYVLIDRIWDIYLADAVAEAVILVFWLMMLRRRGNEFS